MSLISDGEELISTLDYNETYNDHISARSREFMAIKSFVLKAVRTLKGREVSKTAIFDARKMLQQYREEQYKLWKDSEAVGDVRGFAVGSAKDEQIARIIRTLDGALNATEHKEPAPAADTLTFQDSSIGAFSGTSDFTSEAKPSAHARPLPEPREAVGLVFFLVNVRNDLLKEGINFEFTISSNAPIIKFTETHLR